MQHVAIIDYGIGNLRSVQKAFEHVAEGATVSVTEDAAEILAADKVVLPGVGAFGDGMVGMRARGLVGVVEDVVARGVPLLGICVGMQILFDVSEEFGEHPGLGLLPGRVRAFAPQPGLKIPHTGWNQIEPVRDSPLFAGLPAQSYAYFNHGFFCEARTDDTLACTGYGRPYPSIVGRGRLYGIQFHPEKSQQVGLTLLRNFVREG
jgi:glutamine amidotransferase